MLYDELVQPGEYICHHGIKGQKWGKKNGPPYPLGSDQKSASEKKTSKVKNFVFGVPNAWTAYDYKTFIKAGDKDFNKLSAKMSIDKKANLIEMADILTENAYWDKFRNKVPENKIFKGRLKKATDTGLKALLKNNRDSYDPKQGITNDDRFWFACEDQTIGLLGIADLANRLYSKQEILRLVDIGREVNHDLGYDEAPRGAFYLSEASIGDDKWLNDFIDECIKNRSFCVTRSLLDNANLSA